MIKDFQRLLVTEVYITSNKARKSWKMLLIELNPCCAEFL